MLVLTRGVNESIRIGDDIEIVVVRIGPNSVRLGIDCPRDVPVARSELGQPYLRDKPEGKHDAR